MVVAALGHFCFLLEGRSFHVLTDPKPLVFALHRARDAWSARQGCHLAYVAEFTSDLHHVAGADNVVADCLSRPSEELSLPRSTQVASVNVFSGSLATPADRDGSSRDSTAAVVLATQQGPIRWGELARDQLTCQKTQEVLTSLLLEMVVYQDWWPPALSGLA